MSEDLYSSTALNGIVSDDKSFVLHIVQPGLAGLMDGSVFKTSLAHSCLQLIVGGGLVFAAGVLIGQS